MVSEYFGVSVHEYPSQTSEPSRLSRGFELLTVIHEYVQSDSCIQLYVTPRFNPSNVS